MIGWQEKKKNHEKMGIPSFAWLSLEEKENLKSLSITM